MHPNPSHDEFHQASHSSALVCSSALSCTPFPTSFQSSLASQQTESIWPCVGFPAETHKQVCDARIIWLPCNTGRIDNDSAITNLISADWKKYLPSSRSEYVLLVGNILNTNKGHLKTKNQKGSWALAHRKMSELKCGQRQRQWLIYLKAQLNVLWCRRLSLLISLLIPCSLSSHNTWLLAQDWVHDLSLLGFAPVKVRTNSKPQAFSEFSREKWASPDGTPSALKTSVLKVQEINTHRGKPSVHLRWHTWFLGWYSRRNGTFWLCLMIGNENLFVYLLFFGSYLAQTCWGFPVSQTTFYFQVAENSACITATQTRCTCFFLVHELLKA